MKESDHTEHQRDNRRGTCVRRTGGTERKRSAREQGLRTHCDAMLGKLAQMLRLLGVDTRYDCAISGMAAYRNARSEGRLFLTRNRRLERLPGVIFIQSDKPNEQVREVEERLVIRRKEESLDSMLLTRCLVCNAVLARVSREEARPAVPFFIYQIHNEFRRCPVCRRVYWPGSHVENMLQRKGKQNI